MYSVKDRQTLFTARLVKTGMKSYWGISIIGGSLKKSLQWLQYSKLKDIGGYGF